MKTTLIVFLVGSLAGLVHAETLKNCKARGWRSWPWISWRTRARYRALQESWPLSSQSCLTPPGKSVPGTTHAPSPRHTSSTVQDSSLPARWARDNGILFLTFSILSFAGVLDFPSLISFWLRFQGI
jgi:hypothetical protein